MQKEKTKEKVAETPDEKSANPRSTLDDTAKKTDYVPKPRRIRKRFLNILTTRSRDAKFVAGNSLGLALVTMACLSYFSISSGANLGITLSLMFGSIGAAVGSSLSSFINGLTKSYKYEFDGLTGGILQSGLLWMGMLPVAIILNASIPLTVLALGLSTVLVFLLNLGYYRISQNLREWANSR